MMKIEAIFVGEIVHFFIFASWSIRITFKLSYKTGANIMQIGALFASRQPISSNPGAILFARLSEINITPDATVIRITVPIPSAD